MNALARPALRERFGLRPALVYAILDVGIVGLGEWPAEARALLDDGVEVLQLRAKDAEAEAFLSAARAVVDARGAHPTPILVNDRVDVARAAGVDGVHLGRGDLDPADARRVLGEDAIIGATAHSLEELGEIDRARVDYVGYGAVFPTSTRAGSAVCGVEALTRAVAASTLPIVAIGGIGPANVERLRSSQVAGVAVASAVTPVRACPGVVESLHCALRRW